MSTKIIFQGFKVDDKAYKLITELNKNSLGAENALEKLIGKIDTELTKAEEDAFPINVIVSTSGDIYLSTGWQRIKNNIEFDLTEHYRKQTIKEENEDFLNLLQIGKVIEEEVKEFIVFKAKEIYSLFGKRKIIKHPFDSYTE